MRYFPILLAFLASLHCGPLAAEELQAGELAISKAWARFVPQAQGQGMGQGMNMGQGMGQTMGQGTGMGQGMTMSMGGSGAVFLEIENHGTVPDRLIGAESPLAEQAALHGHEMQGGVAKMQQLETLEIPAGGHVTLAPGGLHVMLMGVTAPPRVGDRVPITLTFARAGRVSLDVPVLPLGATGP